MIDFSTAFFLNINQLPARDHLVTLGHIERHIKGVDVPDNVAGEPGAFILQVKNPVGAFQAFALISYLYIIRGSLCKRLI